MATLLDHAQRFLDAHPVRGVAPHSFAAVLQAATIRRLADGEALCTEGEPGEDMAFLYQGTLQVTRRGPDGQPRALATLEAPALVGHRALIDREPRSATCTAAGPAIVGTLDRRAWATLLGEPTSRGMALRRVLLASLTRQMAAANGRIRDIIRPADDGVEDFDDDVRPSEIMRVSGVLEGWKVDAATEAALGRMEVVYDDDARRNPKIRALR
jgi:CRP-like cAMP-binding protein